MNTTLRQRSLPRIRVLFDATYAHRLDGTGRYTREMLRCLQCDSDLTVIALRAPRIKGSPRPLRATVNGLLHLIFSQLWLPAVALIRQAHVVHTMAVAPWFCRPPTVVTIHDALDFYPRFRPSRLWSAYVRTLGRVGAQRADAIVTVSETSAREIVRHYRVTRSKIHVISNAFSLERVEPSEVSEIGEHPYILFVGDDSSRKNLATAIAAVETLRQRRGGVQLVVSGHVDRQLLAGRTWLTSLEGINDSELAWLYQHARALIVPSHYEGFSLPVVEALAYGVPVIASDIPAHREVGGDSVILVAPDDVAGFARRLEEVLASPDTSRTNINTLSPRTWEGSELQLVDLYLGLVNARLGVRT